MENLQGLFLPQMLMLLSRITTKIQSSMMRLKLSFPFTYIKNIICFSLFIM
uniref:Alternative protein DOCK11 n=1 Tax=Homo sapiens TaxID=9606 RepID=L8E958_HUMAN|nr:alternative protein DOCK11 [Homo sapiens]